MTRRGALALLASATVSKPGSAANRDVLLKAALDELARIPQLRVVASDPPYFAEYHIVDADSFSVSASLGALVSSQHYPFRIMDVRVRAGSYEFDNTNHVSSAVYSGVRYDSDQLPLDDDYSGLRQAFWLATDRAYKAALEAIQRKRSSLKNLNETQPLPDYSKMPPVVSLSSINRAAIDEALWRKRIVDLSAVFAGYPAVLSSGVELQAVQAGVYQLNTEGTRLRYADNTCYVRIRGFGQAADGMPVRDAAVAHSFLASGLPSQAALQSLAGTVAANITALSRAPQGDAYTGPVLFDAPAAAQLFAQVLGENLKITRKPVTDPGQPAPHLTSELESRIGSRVLPEWIDVVDDPAAAQSNGQALLGSFRYDLEGVPARAVTLIEKGVLRGFLLTRTPALKQFETSNGHARLPGGFGNRNPGISNLFVRASGALAPEVLKAKFLDTVKQRGKAYGIRIRKMDYPFSGSIEDLRRAAAAMAQSGGGTRPVSPPLLAYRVYPDGHEELIRGVRFRGLSTRSFRDITAASSEQFVFNYLDSPAPFALMGAGNFVSNASVIAPAVLFDEVELERSDEDLLKPPVVPPPPLNG